MTINLSLYDLAALIGALFVAMGLWCFHPALALIGVGVTLVFIGLWGSKPWRSSNESSDNRPSDAR